EETDHRILAEMLDEGLDIIQKLWTGEEISYTGKHYQLNNVQSLPKPFNNHIPIFIGGGWPNKRPMRRAAKYDGVVPISSNWPDQLQPADTKAIISYISEYRDKPIDVMIGGMTPREPEEAAAIIKPHADAGATWWTEDINDLRGDLKEQFERIKQGPPEL
ncbi:MAG: LLM class flavin-dependent oxidoreductase, partial [Candidatus Kariarchaeaceae archaeon]